MKTLAGSNGTADRALIYVIKMKKTYKNVFVTVGTTKFDELISSLSDPENVQALKDIGCERITLQIGSGHNISSDDIFKTFSIVSESFKHRTNITDLIEKSDLVISHAGAGTCLEVLKRKKRLIVVVNESLMDNHQTELAVRLSEKRCALYCTPNELGSVLRSNKLDNLESYESSKGMLYFVKELDSFMGIK